jgi:hypothetical protein
VAANVALVGTDGGAWRCVGGLIYGGSSADL